MKKKLIAILATILIVFIASIIAAYYDSARVRNGHEPKLVIKLISSDSKKVTYWGLGYKVIRFPSVSPNEPYENNLGVKFGNWFMDYKLSSKYNTVKTKDNNNLIIKTITDQTASMSNFACAQALDNFYEDNEYKYYYTCIKSQYIIVEYKNEIEETVKSALKNGHIKITDLDKYNINYLKEEKQKDIK